MNMIHFMMIATDVTNGKLLHEAPLPRWTNVNKAGPQDIFDVANASGASNEINFHRQTLFPCVNSIAQIICQN